MSGLQPGGPGQNVPLEPEPLADQQLRFRCTTGRPNISLSSFHIKVGTGGRQECGSGDQELRRVVLRHRSQVVEVGVRGSKRWEAGQHRRQEGAGRHQGPGMLSISEDLLCPLRIAWPWPPSSCPPACSQPFRLPWLPQSLQIAPCNCWSSEMAVFSAAMATLPVLEQLGLARGVVWPPQSYLQEPVRTNFLHVCLSCPFHVRGSPLPWYSWQRIAETLPYLKEGGNGDGLLRKRLMVRIGSTET